MERVKSKSAHQQRTKSSMGLQRKTLKRKSRSLKKTKPLNLKTKEIQVTKKTRTRIQNRKTEAKEAKGQTLNKTAHHAGTKNEGSTSTCLQQEGSSFVQIGHSGIYSTQLESDEKECLITVIDITHDGKIVVLDSNNATLKIYGAGFQYLTSFKLPTKKDKYWTTSAMKTMAVLTSEEVMLCVFGGTKTLGTSFHIVDIGAAKPSIKNTSYVGDIEVKAMTSYQTRIFIAGVYTRQQQVSFLNQIDRNGKLIWSTSMTIGGVSPEKITMCCMVHDDRLKVLVVISGHASRIRNYDAEKGTLLFDYFITHDKGGISEITCGGNNLYVCLPDVKMFHVYDSSYVLLKTINFGGDPPLCIRYSELHEIVLVSNTGAYPHVIDKLKGNVFTNVESRHFNPASRNLDGTLVVGDISYKDI